jgi:hypothetical protein
LWVQPVKSATREWRDAAVQQDETQLQQQSRYRNKLPYSIALTIATGHYPTLKHLIDAINAVLTGYYDGLLTPHFGLSIDAFSKHVHVAVKDGDPAKGEVGYAFRFPDVPNQRGLGSMLGFDDAQVGRWIPPKGQWAWRRGDITRGAHGIYIYSDLIVPQMVGDSVVPLLRVINPSEPRLQQTLYKEGASEIVSFHYKNIYYFPLIRNQFNTIEIELRTDYGQVIDFFSIPAAKTVVQLHFRRRQ